MKCICWLVGEILTSELLAGSVAFKLSRSPRGPSGSVWAELDSSSSPPPTPQALRPPWDTV